MTPKQQMIMDYLLANCKGINNAKNVADIAHACGSAD